MKVHCRLWSVIYTKLFHTRLLPSGINHGPDYSLLTLCPWALLGAGISQLPCLPSSPEHWLRHRKQRTAIAIACFDGLLMTLFKKKFLHMNMPGGPWSSCTGRGRKSRWRCWVFSMNIPSPTPSEVSTHRKYKLQVGRGWCCPYSAGPWPSVFRAGCQACASRRVGQWRWALNKPSLLSWVNSFNRKRESRRSH